MIHRVPEGGWLKWGLNIQHMRNHTGFYSDGFFFQFHTRWVLYIRRTGIRGLAPPRWEWGWL